VAHPGVALPLPSCPTKEAETIVFAYFSFCYASRRCCELSLFVGELFQSRGRRENISVISTNGGQPAGRSFDGRFCFRLLRPTARPEVLFVALL